MFLDLIRHYKTHLNVIYLLKFFVYGICDAAVCHYEESCEDLTHAALQCLVARLKKKDKAYF